MGRLLKKPHRCVAQIFCPGEMAHPDPRSWLRFQPRADHLLRSTSRTEGHVKCGKVQVEQGAAIKGDFWTGVEKSGGSQAKVNVNNVEPFPSTSVSTGVDRSTTRRKRPNEPKAPVDQYSPLVVRRKIDFNKRPMAVGAVHVT